MVMFECLTAKPIALTTAPTSGRTMGAAAATAMHRPTVTNAAAINIILV